MLGLMPIAQQAASGGQSIWSTVIMFGAIFAIFYFMIIRPQQKRAKEREKLISNLQKGDKVITTGGMYGTVSGIEEKTVLIQISDNVKVKFDKSAVNVVTSSKETEQK
jgi:preprotein translocase subunit YajC